MNNFTYRAANVGDDSYNNIEVDQDSVFLSGMCIECASISNFIRVRARDKTKEYFQAQMIDFVVRSLSYSGQRK